MCWISYTCWTIINECYNKFLTFISVIDNHLKTVTQSVFFRIYNELNIIDDIETNNEKKTQSTKHSWPIPLLLFWHQRKLFWHPWYIRIPFKVVVLVLSLFYQKGKQNKLGSYHSKFYIYKKKNWTVLSLHHCVAFTILLTSFPDGLENIYCIPSSTKHASQCRSPRSDEWDLQLHFHREQYWKSWSANTAYYLRLLET